MALFRSRNTHIVEPGSILVNKTDAGMTEEDGEEIDTGTILAIVIPIVVLVVLIGVLVYVLHRLKMAGVHLGACCRAALSRLPCCFCLDERHNNVPAPPPSNEISSDPDPTNTPENSSPRPPSRGSPRNTVRPECNPPPSPPSNPDTLPTPSFVVEAEDGTEPPPSSPLKDAASLPGLGSGVDPHRTVRRLFGHSTVFESFSYSDGDADYVNRRLNNESSVMRYYQSDDAEDYVERTFEDRKRRRRKRRMNGMIQKKEVVTKRRRSSSSSADLPQCQAQEKSEEEKVVEMEEKEVMEVKEEGANVGEIPLSHKGMLMMDRAGDAGSRYTNHNGFGRFHYHQLETSL